MRVYLLLCVLLCVGFRANAVTGSITFLIEDNSSHLVRSERSLHIVNADGKIVFQATGKKSTFVVEDLPFGLHIAIINRGKCEETTVGGVAFRFDKDVTYRVVLNHCPPVAEYFSNACRIFGRIVDTAGAPAGGATVWRQGWYRSEVADKFGRVKFGVFPGKVDHIFRWRGRDVVIPIECNRIDQYERVFVIAEN